MDESSIWEFYVAEIQLRLNTACCLNSKAPWNVSVISINTHNRMLSNVSGLSFFFLSSQIIFFVLLCFYFFGICICICIVSIYFILQVICIILHIWRYNSSDLNIG